MDKRERTNTRNVKVEDAVLDPEKLKQSDFECDRLPGTNYPNPLIIQKKEWLATAIIHDEERRLMYDPHPQGHMHQGHPVSLSPFLVRLAGPRMSLHFNPTETVVGIVTCGGLCPGMNDVIRGITLSCINSYHVKRVIGFRYGFWGLSAAGRHSAIDLTADTVRPIHRHGGTFLGSSRGPRPEGEMVETLMQSKVNILFTVGGDGTQRGAEKIAKEARRRGHDIGVIGIPKTIDNDLSFSHRTFGYETAVEQAVAAIRAAHAEAASHKYGVGVVKVMGRHSGFIAAQATIASALVNICLIPEMPIKKKVFFNLIERRFATSTTLVICVAEGFGQDWADGGGGKDASGNKKLIDIGVVIKTEVETYLKRDPRYEISTVKYIDPSYMIRAVPPSAGDAAFCVSLSTLAVHEAMAGLTNCLVSYWYDNFIVVPIRLATSIRKIVSIRGKLWRQVREITVDLDMDVKSAIRNNLNRELRTVNDRREQLILSLAQL